MNTNRNCRLIDTNFLLQIERNSRKKLFPNDDSNYPTLKMETPLSKVLPSVHRENEKKKQQIKGIVEEKLQNRSSVVQSENVTVEIETPKPSSPSSPDEKKGLKFGIRVLPPNVNEKMFGKSPNKVQADNENNTNLEKKKEQDTIVVVDEKPLSAVVQKDTPPTAKRRSKDKIQTHIEHTTSTTLTNENEFQRQGSVTSSGIKRDAAGIPQELPNHMMQAAMAAKDNRKSGSGFLDLKRSKGKAPKPPAANDAVDMDASTDTVDTNVSYDAGDAADRSVNVMKRSDLNVIEKLNFTDNFTDSMIEREAERDVKSSTPKVEKFGNNHKNLSDTESQQELAISSLSNNKKEESDLDESSDSSNQIELNSNHITIHQPSEEEEDEGRRTASLGDLSKMKFTHSTSNSGVGIGSGGGGTLERAQSLEINDLASQVHSTGTGNKKRKAPTSDGDLNSDNKEPRLMGHHHHDSLDVRLKSAYEFGTLQDVIGNGGGEDNGDDEAENLNHSVDMVKEVMAAADKFTKELKDEIAAATNLEMEKRKLIEEKQVQEKFIEAEKQLSFKGSQIPVAVMPISTTDSNPQKGDEISVSHYRFTSRNNNKDDSDVEIKTTTTTMAITPTNASIKKEEEPIQQNGNSVNNHHVTISPVTFQATTNSSSGKVLSSSGDAEQVEIKQQQPNITDQVKIINFGTNISDDVKVSRYPFGSLERPKSDVLKKLMGIAPTSSASITTTTTSQATTTTTTLLPDENLYLETQPISLTLIGGGDSGNGGNDDEQLIVENDQTESSQISPVYSSDNQGVNSISISSMEVNIQPDSLITKQQQNIVTINQQQPIENINNNRSQPSSIIMIEDNTTINNVDEKLDFTLQTATNNPPSLTQQIDNAADKVKTFVTEITVSQSTPFSETRKNHVAEMLSSIIEQQTKALDMPDDDDDGDDNNIKEKGNHGYAEEESIKIITSTQPLTMNTSNYVTNFITTEKKQQQQNDDSYIPRNSEIRFTTSTYDQSNKQQYEPKRMSQIEQIRSNFENKMSPTSISSEIPIPVRKSSIPMLKSPSKIPVFNSKQISTDSNGNSGSGGSGGSSPTNGLNNNNNVNRVSVSVTSIKNSSRQPSGGGFNKLN